MKVSRSELRESAKEAKDRLLEMALQYADYMEDKRERPDSVHYSFSPEYMLKLAAEWYGQRRGDLLSVDMGSLDLKDVKFYPKDFKDDGECRCDTCLDPRWECDPPDCACMHCDEYEMENPRTDDEADSKYFDPELD